MKGIYKIVSPTGRIYIGQSIDIDKRRKMYIGCHCRKQQKLHASLIKYGFNEHDFELIEECEESLLNEREEYWIDFYGTFNSELGMNLSSGGLNKRVSEETKLKISNSNKGKKRIDLSERNISNKGRQIGPNPPSWQGKKHSSETIAKMKESALKRGERSEETKAKMSESAKKKVITDEHKQKLLNNRINSDKVGKKVIDIVTKEVFKNLVTLCKIKGLNYGTMKPKMRGAKINNTNYRYL